MTNSTESSSEQKKINMRRVVGTILLLCDIVVFATIAFCTLWLSCACDTDGDEIIRRSVMRFDEFSMIGFWLSIPMYVQYVIPSLWLGQRAMKQSWQSINWWILYPSIIVAIIGLTTGGCLACEMVEVVNRICKWGVVRDAAIYGIDYYTYIVLGLMIFNLIMLIPWTRDIIRRPSKNKEIRDSFVMFGAFMFGICQFFYIWVGAICIRLD